METPGSHLCPGLACTRIQTSVKPLNAPEEKRSSDPEKIKYSFPSTGYLSFPSSPFLYLVETEFWVHDEHMTRGPQTALFLTSPAEGTVVQVIGGLHGDQAEEPPVIRATGAECQFFRRIGRQNLTSVAAKTHAVVHDLGTEPKVPARISDVACRYALYTQNHCISLIKVCFHAEQVVTAPS